MNLNDSLARRWRKSSYSNLDRTCVEVAATQSSVAARDSKDPDGGYLLVSPSAWTSFLDGIRGGRFERS